MNRCSVCDAVLNEDEIVWVNPATGEASTGRYAEPFCVECCPEETE